MKALAGDGNGSFDLKEVDRPVPKEHDVLVRVRASSINDFDLFILERPPLPFRIIRKIMRAFSPGAPPRARIAGCDVAGTVEAVGSGVERFRQGDDVYGDVSRLGFGGFGGWAEYVCAPESTLALKPARMTFEQAGALPQAGVLAAQGLWARGPLRAGQRILINGAGGGVGTIGLQLAKQQDVEVTGVDRASKLEMMRSIGFDHVIDFETDDFTKTGTRYDLILDTKTNRSPFKYLRALTPNGTYATVGGDSLRILQVAVMGWLLRLVSNKRLIMIALKQNKHLADLSACFETGRLTPVIDGPYKLTDAKEALRYFGTAMHKGKVVITIA